MKQQSPTSNHANIYFFGEYVAEDCEKLLGNKGASLAQMVRLGLPVPPGFTVTAQTCAKFINQDALDGLFQEVSTAMAMLGQKTGKIFGGSRNPLLISVRSGAAVSMPGMMDTILNIGLNDEIVSEMLKEPTNARFVNNSYCRLIRMFASIVMQAESAFLAALGDANDGDVVSYKKAFKNVFGIDFPQDVNAQLQQAIVAVLRSWNNERAIAYRQLNKITDDALYTALNIQAMVFGNLSATSGSGVLFSRNPNNGKDELYGEFILRAQGEDIVAGAATPNSISQLQQFFPDIFKQLQDIAKVLENHYGDMQDVEFTFENGKLWILQARSGKRSAVAAVQIAYDLFSANLITREKLLSLVKLAAIEQILHPIIDPACDYVPIAKGLPASPGAACGHISLDRNQAIDWAAAGRKVILVCAETTADDVAGMAAAEGIVTAVGGMTSHAAVVARGMGKPCITAANIEVNLKENEINAGGLILKVGEVITINGSTGEIIKGRLPLQESESPASLNLLLVEADLVAKLVVRANCETAEDAALAKNFGAKGIGLCRTEHMFFSDDRIDIMREMILSKDNTKKQQALYRLQRFQQEDFEKLFIAMQGMPVTVRLLDPPLHEFLPLPGQNLARLSSVLDVKEPMLHAMLDECTEKNPMLGHRGCRLAITTPEIYAMQIKALFSAWLSVNQVTLSKPILEIMIPFVMDVNEIKIVKELTSQLASNFFTQFDIKIPYKLGVMIELPRAALLADMIAPGVDFLSFGTNDLTQATLGISRDDAKKFLPIYLEKGILTHDPFISLDQLGVGELIKTAIVKARATNPLIKIGICGEHGGDPKSIEFFSAIGGVDYVSCSPYRVQVARLAAAKAVLQNSI
jgi:pyruvate,orthophosphate dikinase